MEDAGRQVLHFTIDLNAWKRTGSLLWATARNLLAKLPCAVL